MSTVKRGTQHTGDTFFAMMEQRFQEELEDRREMHLHVGRTIVALSDIERYLAAIFSMFGLPLDEEQSEKMFYAAGSFTRRLELVDYAARRSPEKELHAPWEALSQRIKRQKLVRNIAAHASLEFRQQKGGARAKAIISGKSRGGGKEQELGIDDVTKAADELEVIRGDLMKYFTKGVRTIIKARNIPLDPL